VNQAIGASLCSETCNAATNEGCPVAGTRCQIAIDDTPDKRLYTNCNAAGNGVAGSPCAGDGDCGTGLGCLTTGASMPGASGQCHYWCDTATNKCPVGTCMAILLNDKPIVVGGITYGGCF
jgi:hypothetical protein